MKFIIIHGSASNSSKNWFPWLKKELELMGQEVISPNFPNPPNQNLESWLKTFKPYFDKVDSNTIFIAHSLGPAFVLSILEKIKIKVKTCYFVSGFTGALGIDLDKINKTFTEKEFEFSNIRSRCQKFICFASDNDPYVPLERTREFSEKINGKLIVIKKAGHFNTNAGYTTFEKLLEEIKKDL